MSVFVAVDTGGTFTDLVAFDAGRRSVVYTKSLTTHGNPIDGILDCIGKAQVVLEEAVLFKHGTTLVINTLLERSGPPIALVTTEGFRDVLEFGRGNRTEPFNLFFRRDPPLVPRERRFELRERIQGDGTILEAPDRAGAQELIERLRELDVAAVAVSFINSYLEPRHEAEVAAWLRQELPNCFVTTGTEITREWYEYERTATAAANAYAGPRIGSYVAVLDHALKERGFPGRLFMMGSNGGLLSAQHASTAPVLLVESGPVGGCIGAAAYARVMDMKRVIAFDMGGTTAKCALVRDGHFEVESIYHAGGYGRGTPIRAPVVDIVEIGAGGGSIARVDAQGALKVGPQSAGSMPGPVCYGRGGTEPTVTDANLVLGRLDPGSFQGGEMRLDPAAALHAFGRLGERLGYTGEQGVQQLASGVLSIASVLMGEAIKRITVQRGQDPRDYVLFVYGGGGPLHAFELARELGIPRIVVPPEAGNFSAIGMLLADIRRDTGRTFLCRLEQDAIPGIQGIFAEMEQDIVASIAADFGDVEVTIQRAAEMRFLGQHHTVRIPVETDDAALLRKRFHDIYRGRFGHAIETSPAEIVSLHCTALASTPRPDIERLAGDLPVDAAFAPAVRHVYFRSEGGTLPANVYRRSALPIGFTGAGPAIIEEYGSTTIVGPGDTFEIGRLGEIGIMLGVDARP